MHIRRLPCNMTHNLIIWASLFSYNLTKSPTSKASLSYCLLRGLAFPVWISNILPVWIFWAVRIIPFPPECASRNLNWAEEKNHKQNCQKSSNIQKCMVLIPIITLIHFGHAFNLVSNPTLNSNRVVYIEIELNSTCEDECKSKRITGNKVLQNFPK